MKAVLDALALLARRGTGAAPAAWSPAELERVTRALGAERDAADVQALAGFCRLFLRAYENHDYDIATNGELWLLRQLAPFKPRVVFDVGANVGDWSRAALDALDGAVVHAFEAVPDTARHLGERLAGAGARAVANAFGLSDRTGSMTLRQFAGDSRLSTFAPFPHGEFTEVACPVRTGDDYMKDKGIEHVDLLKIDVEGAEHLVLSGFARAVGEGRIDAIQFEYGRVNILTRIMLRDFHAILEPAGYAVGKLFPNGVDFRAYDLEDENFLGPNHVAARTLRPDLVEALRRRPGNAATA